MLGFDALAAWFRRQERAVQGGLALTAISRLWLAATDHSVYWPDEIYQSIEPAHRLAFGWGLLPWEFRDGARSWSFPALLAVPIKILGLLHVHSGLAYVLAARLVMVLFALAGAGVAVEYARRLGGKSAALIAAFAVALFPPLLTYSHRTLQEAASAPLIALVPLLLLTRSPLTATRAGVVVGIASVLRFQCAALAAGFLVGLIFERRWEELRAFVKAGAIVALAAGLLDWITWGAPFHSFVTYVQFNLIRSGASSFGVAPRSYFLTTLWTSSGPAFVLLVIGFSIAGWNKARAAAASIVVFVALHSAIPHKEFRFLLPVLPLTLSLGAVGLVELCERRKAWTWAPAVLTGVLSIGFIKAARGATYGSFGQYGGTPRAADSVFDTEEEPNLLLADVGTEQDVCGVLALGIRAAFTGGYSYLHRHVPLIYRFQACDEAKAANYVIAATSNTNVPSAFRLVRTRRGYGLYKRPGTCEHPPDDFSDNMLDGSEDMGVNRAPLVQPDPSELRISAGTSASAFVRGFSNSEHMDCRSVRWATGTASEIAFPLEPNGRSYTLTFTAQPYGGALPQAIRVAINGSALGDFQMEEGWRGYQAYVPSSLLKRGRNTLDFAFARAMRATGSDSRRLSALFDQITLAPADTSVNIDVGTEEARAFLTSGFSGDERTPHGTFVWSDGPKSELTVTLREVGEPMVFEIIGQAYHHVAPLKVEASVNGKSVGSFTAGKGTSRNALLVPAGTLKVGSNKITLNYGATAKPSEAEPNTTDTRELAFQFDRLLLAPLPISTHVDLGTPAAHPFEAEGFSYDEDAEGEHVVWSDGPHSKIWFRGGADLGEACTLRVKAAAFAPLVPFSVAVSANGKKVGEFSPDIAFQTHEVPIPSGTFSSDINTLQFDYGRTARPREVNPGSTDERQLAVRFDRLDVDCVADETP